jgi:predicted kinase
MGAVLLSTDAIRREATRPEQPVPGRYGVAGYSDAARDAVYGEMIARALAQLRSGRSVVLDATFLTQEQRAWAMDAARDSGVPALVVQVTAPEDVVRARLLARAGDGGVSDARWDTYLVQRRTVEPPVEIEPGSVMAVDASGVAGPVADAVMRRLQSSV